MEEGMTRNKLVILLVWSSFILGFFFNAANPSFYPAGTYIPNTSSCDLLSQISRTCIQSVSVPWMGGTIKLNFDIVITSLTFGTLIAATLILERKEALPF